MTKYGYLRTNPSSGIAPALFSENSMVNAIKEVQKYGAIKQTGQLDEATLDVKLYLQYFYNFLIFHYLIIVNEFAAMWSTRHYSPTFKT